MNSLALLAILFLAKSTLADDYRQGHENCGIAGSPGGLVFGGEVSEELQWPWLAAIYHAEMNVYFCGGTLVSKRIISTVSSSSDSLLHYSRIIVDRPLTASNTDKTRRRCAPTR